MLCFPRYPVQGPTLFSHLQECGERLLLWRNCQTKCDDAGCVVLAAVPQECHASLTVGQPRGKRRLARQSGHVAGSCLFAKVAWVRGCLRCSRRLQQQVQRNSLFKECASRVADACPGAGAHLPA